MVFKLVVEKITSTDTRENYCETVGELGMSCVALQDYPNATFNGFTKRLRPKNPDVVHPEYAAYFFRSFHFRWQVYAMSSISTRASLNNGMLNKLQIILPPMPIQKEIGNALTSLDELRRNSATISNNLSSQIEALFRSWFIDFDPVKAKAEGKLPYGMDDETAALFPDTFENTEYGSIPHGWNVTKVDKLCKSVNYGFTASSNEDPTGQKFLRITDIIPRQLNWNSVPYCQISDDLLSKYQLEHGDIVIARTGAGVGVAKRLHKPPAEFGLCFVFGAN